MPIFNACDIKEKLKYIWAKNNCFSYYHLTIAVDEQFYDESVLMAYIESDLITCDCLKYMLQQNTSIFAIKRVANHLVLKGAKIRILDMLKVAITGLNVSIKVLEFLINRLPTNLALKVLSINGIVNDYKKLNPSPNASIVTWFKEEFNRRAGIYDGNIPPMVYINNNSKKKEERLM